MYLCIWINLAFKWTWKRFLINSMTCHLTWSHAVCWRHRCPLCEMMKQPLFEGCATVAFLQPRRAKKSRWDLAFHLLVGEVVTLTGQTCPPLIVSQPSQIQKSQVPIIPNGSYIRRGADNCPSPHPWQVQIQNSRGNWQNNLFINWDLCQR